jgi:hypothetical protein
MGWEKEGKTNVCIYFIGVALEIFFYKHWVTIRFRKSMEKKGNLSLSKIRLVSEKALKKLS